MGEVGVWMERRADYFHADFVLRDGRAELVFLTYTRIKMTGIQGA